MYSMFVTYPNFEKLTKGRCNIFCCWFRVASKGKTLEKCKKLDTSENCHLFQGAPARWQLDIKFASMSCLDRNKTNQGFAIGPMLNGQPLRRSTAAACSLYIRLICRVPADNDSEFNGIAMC